MRLGAEENIFSHCVVGKPNTKLIYLTYLLRIAIAIAVAVAVAVAVVFVTTPCERNLVNNYVAATYE